MGSFIVYSLAWGSALALMASGLSLYYSVSKVANFAHGSYASIGLLTYIVIIGLINGLSRMTGYNILGAAAFTPHNLWLLVPVFIVGGLVALATFTAVFWPLMKRGATPLQLMVASIGVMFVLRFIMYVIAGQYNWLSLSSPGAPEYTILGTKVSLAEIVAIGLVAASVIGIALMETKTMIGVSLRAVASNPSLAEATGINSFRIQGLAWFIGGGLAALGGLVMYILTGPPGARPIVELGWMNLLPIFAAATLGGLGSFYGTVAAGIILGFAFNEAAAWITTYLGLDSSLALAIPFGLTLLVLLFFPQGLAGIDWRGVLARISRITLRRAEKVEAGV